MNYRIEIHSEVESEAVQKHAFKMGAYWPQQSKELVKLYGKYLIIEDFAIRCTSDRYYYDHLEGFEKISVDDFLSLKSLSNEIQNSKGDYLISFNGYHHNEVVINMEILQGRRFNTSEQAERAHYDLGKLLSCHQVANALGLKPLFKYGFQAEENTKKIDMFVEEMGRRSNG